MAAGEAPMDDLKDAESEGAVEPIAGLLGGSEIYRSAVNIPNQGHIANLPEGAIVEVPALVGEWGIRGLSMSPLPEAIAELCHREVAVTSLIVEAAATGSQQTTLEALLLDSCINDVDTTQAILDAYPSENADYLPQFQ